MGPAVPFTVRYSQRDNQFSSTFNYSNFGPKWTFDWLAYIMDDPATPQADVTYYMRGGGNRTFTGFDTTTQTFAYQVLDQTLLTRTSPSTYQMLSPDGTLLVFGQSDGGVTTRRVFLTQVIDPAGNAVTLTYDSDLRITAITDAIGQQTTLEYGNTADTFKITTVTDPFGRSAAFGYNTAGQLISITDALGLVSAFTYDPTTTDLVTTLTTPYGVTQFTNAETGTTRSMEILYPDGNRERVEFNQSTTLGIAVSDPPQTVPSGMTTINNFLYFRNTYYWDKQGCAYAYGDYTKARIYHWLHSADLQSPVGILESTKAPLEGRVWYDYTGQNHVQQIHRRRDHQQAHPHRAGPRRRLHPALLPRVQRLRQCHHGGRSGRAHLLLHLCGQRHRPARNPADPGRAKRTDAADHLQRPAPAADLHGRGRPDHHLHLQHPRADNDRNRCARQHHHLPVRRERLPHLGRRAAGRRRHHDLDLRRLRPGPDRHR